MKKQTFADVFDANVAEDAILNEEHPGFKEDYLVLHCLLRKYDPKSVFEIGTNMGTGTNIICNAVKEAVVETLDLPSDKVHSSMIREGRDYTGYNCHGVFSQVRGDSMTFNYRPHKSEAYFIDGEHDYDHPLHETKKVLEQDPKLIVWHDTDIAEVAQAIQDAFAAEINGTPNYGNENYNLYRITDTRITYAVRKGSE